MILAGCEPSELIVLLERIAGALERLAGPPSASGCFAGAVLNRYDAATQHFLPAPDFPLPLDLLLGVEAQKTRWVENLRRFASGLPFNHALLWGARGAGKSSLVKSAVMAQAAEDGALRLLEVEAEVVNILPHLFATLRNLPHRTIVLCDDLSFEEGAGAAKALKSALEGGVMGPPPNVMFVATSNRRHLAPRGHDDADRLTSVETADEVISVSDRFGLSLGFPPMDQPTYLAAVAGYAARFGLDAPDLDAPDLDAPDLDRRALQWAQARGGRSGRVAWQFIRDLAGEQGRVLPL